jgi:CheY-like chemotaxis protein
MTSTLILLVEDSPVARFVTQKQIAQLGYTSETAASGEEAVEKYDGNFSLIFMDVGLPGIDGIEATKQIRERERNQQFKHVPIIALTAHSNKEQCLAAGMDDHLQKPALIADLKRMLDSWLPDRASAT